jgi:hypothetical protein
MDKITNLAPRGLTEAEFCAWVGRAEPGDVLEYHYGFLAVDASAGPLSPAEQKVLRLLARRALWSSNRGLVHLVQQRRGPGSFRYLAIKRRRPRATMIAAAALVDCLVEAA